MPVYKNDANLVSLWLLNNDATDSVGSNDLTNNNTVTFSTDRIEGSHSADFERDTSESLSITDAAQAGLGITGNLSICFWIKPESVAAPEYQLVAKYRTGDSNRSYRVVVDSVSPFGIRANLSSNGTAVAAARGATAIQAGIWQHVAVVYNGTDIRIYLDGVLDSNGSLNPLAYTAGIFNGAAVFYLGFQDGSSNYYDGLMDEVAIFSRELSAAEVLDIKENHIQDPVVQHNLSATVALTTATPDATLNISRTLSATSAWQTTTPNAALVAARSLAATTAWQALTADATLTAVRPLSATVGIQTATPSAALAIARLLAATSAWQSATPDAALVVARLLSALSAWQTETPDAELTTGAIQLTAAITMQAATPAAALTVTRPLAATSGWQSITGDANLSTGLTLSAIIGIQTTTPAATLTLAHSLAASVSWQTVTPAGVMTLTIAFAAVIGIQTTTSAATLETGVLIVGVVSAAFSSTKPGAAFSSIKPGVSFLSLE